MDNERHTLGTHLILALVAFSWGTNNIIMKIGFNHVTAGQFGGIRMNLEFIPNFYMNLKIS